MFLKIQKRNGREYLSVVQSYREGDKVKSRTVETIGYADAYAGEYDDPIEHFREYVRGLNADESTHTRSIGLSFALDDQIEPAAAPSARLGAAIALGCLDALGIQEFFHARMGREGFPSYAGRVFEMLAVERMMHATSKRESWVTRASFPRPCDFSFAEVYEALSCFARVKRGLDDQSLRKWKQISNPADATDAAPSFRFQAAVNELASSEAPERIFLVCGSYSFPVDGGALRASIAVALDEGGMPLGYHDMLGRLNPAAFREATDTLKDRLDAGRAIAIAGGLRDLGPTIDELAKTGDGFVFYQRDFTTIPELATWAQDEEGYEDIGAGVHIKWRTTTRTLSNGKALPVKEVVLRGGGYATSYSHAMLVSSELDLSAAAIVQLYRELWRQAEPFQPLEADFSSMPHPTPAPDHIQAHFAICYAAFFALRMLRWKCGWKHNAADAADALLRMEGVHLQQNYYLFSYRSKASEDIELAVNVPLSRRLRTRAELRSVPATVVRALLPR